MALAAISDEISRHVAAVLVLSKRDILLRLLREAELCVEHQQVRAAAILGGIVLEELSPLTDPTMLGGHERNIEVWRELRNRAAHPMAGAQDVEPGAVTIMLTGIRALLDQIDISSSSQRPPPRPGSQHVEVRGKYAFLPTSVEEFLKRKHEDLDLESRQ